MIVNNDQLIAALSGSICANGLVDLLPETDLTDSLKNILCIQREILTHYVEGRHYGSNNIDMYLEHIHSIWAEINRLDEANKEDER
jgi:hypothetical protein